MNELSTHRRGRGRDGQGRDGRGRNGRGRDLAIAGGALAVVVAITGGSVIFGAVGAAFGRDAAVATAQVLGGEQAKSDRLPAGFPSDQHGDGGIVTSTTRILGTQNGTRYWIALDRRSNVCVLVQSVTDAQLTAAACSAPAELEARGESLRIDSGTWKLEAFLLPDSVDASSLKGGWSAVADNLVTYVGSSPSGGSIKLARDDGASGAPITLTREPDPAGR